MTDEGKLTRRQVVGGMAAGSIVSVACARTPSVPSGASINNKRQMAMQDPITDVTPLPSAGPWPTHDPFLFCVHHNDRYPKGTPSFGPDASLEGRNLGQDFANKDGWNMYHGDKIPGFPRHPHRGFETVTFVKSGMIDHADSLGASARYGDGDVQWLTAGDGINHAEMFPLLNQTAENPMDFFQIWLNLPAARKRVPAHFAMLWAEALPKIELPDSDGRRTKITIVSGAYYGSNPPSPPPNSWAANPSNSVGIMRIELPPKGSWTVPVTEVNTKLALYIAEGSVQTSKGKVYRRARLTLQPRVPLTITALDTPAMLLLLEGQPINEPVVQHGPFVMNTRQEIMTAFADYRRTQFGGWPWSTSEPNHGGNRRRFAHHADGRRDEPT